MREALLCLQQDVAAAAAAAQDGRSPPGGTSAALPPGRASEASCDTKTEAGPPAEAGAPSRGATLLAVRLPLSDTLLSLDKEFAAVG